MPQTAVDEELFELCTEFENVFHRCIPREMMPLWVTDEKLKEAIRSCLQQKKDHLLTESILCSEKQPLFLVSLSDLNRAVAKQPKQKNEMDFPEKGCLSHFFVVLRNCN